MIFFRYLISIDCLRYLILADIVLIIFDVIIIYNYLFL